MIPRRRGRPKKAEAVLDERDMIKKELDAHMARIEYIYNNENEKEESNLHKYMATRRDAINDDFFKEKLFTAPIWAEDNKILLELTTKYFKYFDLREVPESIAYKAAAENGVDENTVTDILSAPLPTIEEEIEEKENLLKERTNRQSYIEKYKPLSEFPQDALDALPQEKKQILVDHYDQIFDENITYQEQIETVLRLIYDPVRGHHSGPTAIGRLFGITGGTVSVHYKRMNKARNVCVGRPRSLSDDELHQIILYIRTRCENQRAPNIYHLIDYAFDTFHVSIRRETLKNILLQCECLKKAHGVPLESSRAEVPVEIVLSHYKELDAILEKERIPPAFFFNVDESGFQDYVDSRPEVVFVPADSDEQVYYSVQRQAKRATIIGCICADGSAMKPLVVSPNKTITRELLIMGYNESNCHIVSQENGFINSEIFAWWFVNVFLRELRIKRESYSYNGLAILTMDGCSPHKSDYVLDEASANNVYPFFEPPGTSDQVQALDLGIFALQKKIKTRYNPNKSLTENDKAIVDIVDSWRKATTPKAVTSAFEQAGFYIICDKNQQSFIRADANRARAVRGIEHTQGEKHVIDGRKTITLPCFSRTKCESDGE